MNLSTRWEGYESGLMILLGQTAENHLQQISSCFFLFWTFSSSLHSFMFNECERSFSIKISQLNTY